jgi:hypothetical protein
MDGSETQISYQNDSQTTTSTMGTIDAQRPLYTVPGILHFLQHEWTRFDLERQQWETERAELQVNKFSFDNVSFIVNFLGTYRFSSR